MCIYLLCINACVYVHVYLLCPSIRCVPDPWFVWMWSPCGFDTVVYTTRFQPATIFVRGWNSPWLLGKALVLSPVHHFEISEAINMLVNKWFIHVHPQTLGPRGFEAIVSLGKLTPVGSWGPELSVPSRNLWGSRSKGRWFDGPGFFRYDLSRFRRIKEL
jgi:hypothetical protein